MNSIAQLSDEKQSEKRSVRLVSQNKVDENMKENQEVKRGQRQVLTMVFCAETHRMSILLWVVCGNIVFLLNFFCTYIHHLDFGNIITIKCKCPSL